MADMEILNLEGKRPLHEAVQFGMYDCVRYLLSKNVDINALKRGDWTPLMLACTKKNLEIIQLLIEKGAILKFHNKDGWNAFHIACREGHSEIVSYLLTTDPQLWKTTSKNGRVPLHTAALYGCTQVIRILLEQEGCDPNIKDSCGTTPCMEAAKGGHVHVLELLYQTKIVNNGATDQMGRSALHIAAQVGQVRALDYLLQQGADINIPSPKDGQTPLHSAAKENQTKSILFLLEHGALPNLKDTQGRTAKDICTLMDNKECLHLFVLHSCQDVVMESHNNVFSSPKVHTVVKMLSWRATTMVFSSPKVHTVVKMLSWKATTMVFSSPKVHTVVKMLSWRATTMVFSSPKVHTVVKMLSWRATTMVFSSPKVHTVVKMLSWRATTMVFSSPKVHTVVKMLSWRATTMRMPGHRKRRQFKQTDAFTRGMVIGLKRAGWSIRQIAADTHLGASTVHRLWRRWLEQGNVAIYRNVGATRVTSARVDRRILRQAVAAPQATCTAILQHVQDTLDHSISTRTISHRLVANGLHSCRPLRRLPLTPPNGRQRLEWCRARSTWMTEWHRVVFSDESRFCLSSDSRRVHVWRRRGERSNPAAIVERPTVRQRGIMVWGAIAYDSRSPLLRIQGTMTAQRYVDDVLRPVTLPYLQGVPNALYQQDNARPHTARISQQALQDVQMLPWPPYSPDLSPIEHVWDIIGRRLHALLQPRSEDELWQMVEREWRAIPQDAIRTLIDSLPRGVAACIAVRGGPTCY
ncbi:ANKRD16 [Cordylochernes scorpioides]|uniref:ANKRD16 n=1 Tax=Cordylochernes scorpioides TaxID=51811 RepID=A0ABY6KX22_9ARAC|nr:ANKRD16 [Cordylochernes scorpioides]